jgi:LacI family transcriptional regulator
MTSGSDGERDRGASVRPTIAEVARTAGVSKTTVSHVLSGRRPVAPKTRARVQTAVEQLGYRPDSVARSLRLRRSHTVALIIPDITNPFFPVLARGFEDELNASGYRTFICNTDAKREQELAFAWEAFNRRVDGIAIVALAIQTDDVIDLLGKGIPLISIGGHLDHPEVDVVVSDDEAGAYEATVHLLERGCERVGMIRGTEGSGTERVEGYLRALREAGVRHDPELLVKGDWTGLGGAGALMRLLSLPAPPDGVFCANDIMAIGALSAARDAGLRVPDEVAIVGFDDIDAAALVHPPLSTVLNPAYETGAVAARLLQERMTDGAEPVRRRSVLPCKLIVRATA